MRIIATGTFPSRHACPIDQTIFRERIIVADRDTPNGLPIARGRQVEAAILNMSRPLDKRRDCNASNKALRRGPQFSQTIG